MKFSERLSAYQEENARRVPRAKRVRGAREISQERIGAERERLSPEDQLLAATFSTPRNPQERREAALALRTTPSGRKRTYWEVAAILGVAPATVAQYVWDPDGSKAKRSRDSKTPATPRKKRPSERRTTVEVDFAPPKEAVGDRIHRRRRTRKLSQVKLASLLDIDVEMLRSWEAGTSKPTPAQYAQVAEVLGL